MNNIYSFYAPSGSYDTVLNQMADTKVNSIKTSSIPLADFWHPERNYDLQNTILKAIGVSDYLSSDKIFECATPAYQKGSKGKTIRYSRPSYTDYMIIGKEHRIAIEAKYTEYLAHAQKSVGVPFPANRISYSTDRRRKAGLSPL